MAKRLLILTGPQGAGNHLWSKIFNTHWKSNGWNNEEYWEGHNKEPFNKYWADPSLIYPGLFEEEFNVTSISCPYWRNGAPQIPMYNQFIMQMDQLEIDVTLCVLSRDKNILEAQQKRVRGNVTMDTFIRQLPHLYADYFLSYETLQVFKHEYLQKVQKDLDWPIDIRKCSEIIEEDANKKYVQSVRSQPLDAVVKQACRDS
jgi:hypothetical protein